MIFHSKVTDLNANRTREMNTDTIFADDQIIPKTFKDTVQLNPEIGNNIFTIMITSLITCQTYSKMLKRPHMYKNRLTKYIL